MRRRWSLGFTRGPGTDPTDLASDATARGFEVTRLATTGAENGAANACSLLYSAAWRAAGLPLSTEEEPPGEGDFVPRPGGMPVLDAEGAAALAREGLLLDARAGERYRGEVEPIDPVAGHIPGAVNAPTTENVTPGGTFLPRQALAARFSLLGAGAAKEVGVYCGSGVSAAHEVLALAEAGITASLYPGSWSEWTASGLPVSTGPTP